MEYRDSTGPLDTSKKILKVNHAGEFGAINIYRAQISVAYWLMPDLLPLLQDFLIDERRHMEVFWAEIRRRDGVRCRSYWLCGIGGWVMGLISALLGRNGVMACTWAVESVVVEHLGHQLAYLEHRGDRAAWVAVQSILDDEKNHRDAGQAQGGRNALYAPLRWVISTFTESVIRFGMR